MQLLNKKTVEKKQVNSLIFESYLDSKLNVESSKNNKPFEDKSLNKKVIKKDVLFNKIKNLLDDL